VSLPAPIGVHDVDIAVSVCSVFVRTKASFRPSGDQAGP
jgi:hypothetical protein